MIFSLDGEEKIDELIEIAKKIKKFLK